MKIEKKVEDTIRKYKLFSKKDKILVACSGGKDSNVVLYILKKLGYNVEAITIDVLIGKYTKENLEILREFCLQLGVKLHEVSFREKFGKSLCYIQSVLRSKGHSLKSCTVCGVLRRYLLNKEAKKLKPDVIVTGHNLDDEAQVIMMNYLRNNLVGSARLGPKTGLIKHKNFVPRVKPLYFVHEDEVIKFSKLKKFKVNYGECPCSTDAYRREIKNMFSSLSAKERENIVNSFLDILPLLKEKYIGDCEIKECIKCGEPSNNKECNTCVILSKLK